MNKKQEEAAGADWQLYYVKGQDSSNVSANYSASEVYLMRDMTKKVTQKEVESIALEYVKNNPSTVFEFRLESILKDEHRHPSWSVIFEMRTFEGDIVDGPLILGIDEYGEILLVG